MSQKVEVVKHLAVLREGNNGWRQELNLVSWYGNPPKYDIRWWSAERKESGKGITLRDDELMMLYDALTGIKELTREL